MRLLARGPRSRSRFASLLGALALAVALSASARAHEIPTDVAVQVFLKPEGQVLHLVLRVPLGAMRDVEFPTRGASTLDLGRAEPALRQAAELWVVDSLELFEGERRLPRPRIVAVRAALPSDRSFRTFEEARAHLADPSRSEDPELPWNQALLDLWLQYPVHSDASRFSIRPGLGRLGLRVVMALRFLPPSAPERAFELRGDPGLVRLDPRWHQAALRFVAMGFSHILDGIDHLLFLLCLVIPFRRWRPLVIIVTAFTLAHSITLFAAAFGLAPDALWFPPLIETLIAASIVYMALENVVAPHLRARWVITFAFGLVHGFGFSFGLRETLQFAGSHLLTSLLCFNLGVELGQLAVLLLLLPALHLLFRRVVSERVGTIVLSVLVAHTGWHWMTERFSALRQFPFEAPAWNAALAAGVLRGLILIVVAAGAAWLVFGVLLGEVRRRAEPGAEARADD